MQDYDARILQAQTSYPVRGGLGRPCTVCSEQEARINLQYSGEELQYYCLDCYNREMSAVFGVPFFDGYKKSIRMYRVDGKSLDFSISYMLFYPVGAQWTALSRDGTLEFKLLGSPFDPEEALNDLKMKVGRGLNTRSLDQRGSLKDSGWMRIEHDYTTEETSVVVDERRLSMEELGDELQPYDGWYLKYAFVEPSDAFEV